MPDTTYRVFFTISQAQRNFRELDDQAQHSDEPHPEDGTGAACCDSDGNTGDIADTQCRCQCRTGRLERLDIAVTRTFVKDFAKGILHDMPKIRKLKESQPDRHKNSHKRRADEQRPAPDKVGISHHTFCNQTKKFHTHYTPTKYITSL